MPAVQRFGPTADIDLKDESSVFTKHLYKKVAAAAYGLLASGARRNAGRST